MSPAPRLSAAWTESLDAWTDAMRSEGRAASTIAARVKYVRGFARDTGATNPWSVVLEDMTSWVATRAGTEKSAYAHRQALRMFYAWAERAGRTGQNLALYLDAANGGRPIARRSERPTGSSGPLPAWTPSSWERALSGWERECRARGLSRNTIASHGAYVRRLARAYPHLGPFDVSGYDLVDWLSSHDGWANETRRMARAALRSFYRWAHEAGHAVDDPSARLPKVAATAPMPRPASETAVQFAVMTATRRERLMVRLAAELGMRRGEVAAVHSRDLVEQDGGWSLVVHGKGARTRILPLPAELVAELHSLPPGFAFPSRTGGHLTPRYVGKVVARLLPAGVTMHALRHRFATRLYERERDVFVVQQALGHARPETTRRYVEVADDRLRAAVVGLARATTRSPEPVGAR
ncbi:tyrosine-type recombinase/integrase [Cellulosimicrobium cellulans]|uniref:tyrosine-type recombinase/integrase n=1 Tax=Cellulosimicrobium cellulans TaxID=1710 RepID=UPI0024051476|nr:tyrosine-type recombinase/integrase [Cellulosimicrobium cellulans]MDF9876163.1 integrase [Cellulosimicrobium cellulans]